MTNYQEATFNLAGEGDFYGIHDPSNTWNGFANPLFTIDVVRQIVELVKEQNANSADEQLDELVVRNYGLVTHVGLQYADDGTIEMMPSFLVNGQIFYAVMNDAWCWGVNSWKASDGAPEDSPAVVSEV